MQEESLGLGVDSKKNRFFDSEVLNVPRVNSTINQLYWGQTSLYSSTPNYFPKYYKPQRRRNNSLIHSSDSNHKTNLELFTESESLNQSCDTNNPIN